MFYTIEQLHKLYLNGVVSSIDLEFVNNTWRLEVSLTSGAVVYAKTARGEPKTYSLVSSAMSDAKIVTGYSVRRLTVK